MVLIIGAYGAGKTEYVRSLGYPDAALGEAVDDGKPVLLHLEALVRQCPDGADALADTLCKKEIVVCREVGSGVIPLKKEDRTYRDAVGRLCVRLAKEAASVVRVVAGIPVAIKGELPCAFV